MSNRRPPKGYFTEMEVAASIGVSVDEIRSLVRLHILKTEEELANLPKTWFQPSDVLLLRLLVSNNSRASLAS